MRAFPKWILELLRQSIAVGAGLRSMLRATIVGALLAVGKAAYVLQPTVDEKSTRRYEPTPVTSSDSSTLKKCEQRTPGTQCGSCQPNCQQFCICGEGQECDYGGSPPTPYATGICKTTPSPSKPGTCHSQLALHRMCDVTPCSPCTAGAQMVLRHHRHRPHRSHLHRHRLHRPMRRQSAVRRAFTTPSAPRSSN